MDNPQTLQAFLEGEAQRWDWMADSWEGEAYSTCCANCRAHAARLRKLAAAMADRVVVRPETWKRMTPGIYLAALVRHVWNDDISKGDTPAKALDALQAHLTSDGRGWPEEVE